jgi:hypothetical protein
MIRLKAIKIWERIEKAFIEIESNDIKVHTIIIPLKYLKILEMKSVQLPSVCSMAPTNCYVERTFDNRKKIFDAYVKIGKHFLVQGTQTVHV